MPSLPHGADYEVLIAGAGPAGAVCATLLARAGIRVLLANGASGRKPRPTEVFSPATLRLIRHLELPAPDASRGTRTCRGVLSVWGLPGEQFFDYGLYACGQALMVDRQAYDALLVAAARAAGAAVLPSARPIAIERQEAGWRAADRHVNFIIDASGRTGSGVPQAIAPRRFDDRLVSFTTFHRGADIDTDVLLLEAVKDGWWYVAHHASGVSCIVYLSDADLVPRGEEARADHLRRSFAATRLIRERLGAPPAFVDHRVIDARTSERTRLAGATWLAVGDAAFSTDPLSGEGMRHALASADRAAAATVSLLRTGAEGALDAYAAWCREEHADQLHRWRDAYRAVAPRFHGELFWRRRIDGGAGERELAG